MRLGLFLSVLLISANLFAQDKFPTAITNAGRDFWFTVPPALEDVADENKVFIFVAPFSDSEIKLSIPGIAFNEKQIIKKGDYATFSISPAQAQIYSKKAQDPVVESNVFENRAINITSDVPAIVYVVLQYGNSSEGFSPLPSASLGMEYIVSSYGDASKLYPSYNSFPSLCGVVGAFDNTVVEFTMPANSKSNVAGNYLPGETVEKLLNKGDVWMISSRDDESDLSGAKITSNLPVSVISGNHSANIPLLNRWNNYIAETEIPVHAWGYSILVPTVKNKKFSPVLRIFGKENNTEIFADGNLIGKIDNNNSFIEYRFNDKIGSMIGAISSDKPIRAMLYNSGTEEDAPSNIDGSTFQMNLIPNEQFADEIIFLMPFNSSQFTENYITIIHEGNFLPDDFLYSPLKELNWKKLNSNFIDKTEKFHFSPDGKIYSSTRVLFPNEGVFVLKADTKFAAYLYGYNGKMSYGIPAAVTVNDKQSGDMENPVPSWIQECNGDVDGIVADKPNSDNRSNLSVPIFDAQKSKNYDRIFGEIIPGITSFAEWRLNVRDKSKEAQAHITFRDMAGNDTTISIFWFPVEARFIPERLNFGNLAADEEVLQTVILQNFGEQDINFTEFKLAKSDSPFKLATNYETPQILQSDSSLSFDIICKSSEQGYFTDTLIAVNDCYLEFYCIIEVKIASPDIEVTDINFGKQVINTTVTYSADIINPSTVILKISDYEGPESKVFKLRDLEIKQNEFLEIPPGGKYTFSVDFTPTESINYTDYIRFISNASDNPGISDDICLINALGIEPGLSANSINWNRRRINMAQYPAGPYLPNNQGIILKNKGIIPVTVSNISISDSSHFDYFQFNDALFKNLELNPDDSLIVAVTYQPDEPGFHKLIIDYSDDNSGNASTILEGIGVVPKVKSVALDLDTCVIGKVNSPNTALLRIENMPHSEWEFADTLNIYDIRASQIGEISFNSDEFGSLGFRIDKSKLQFPIRLAPGEFINIAVDFSAVQSGLVESELIVISDSYTSGKFLLSGYGIEKEIEIINGYAETCIGKATEIKAIIKNNGSSVLNISKVEFETLNSAFNFEDASIADGFEVLPNSSKEIILNFLPTNDRIESVSVVIYDSDNSTEYKATFTGRAVVKNRALTLSPLSKEAEIEEIFSVNLKLEQGELIDDLGIQSFEIHINHNGNILFPNDSSFRLGDNYFGKFKINDIKQISQNDFLVNIASIAGDNLSGSGNLLSWDYQVFFPQGQDKSSLINVTMITHETECVSFSEAISEIKLQPVCADSLRRFHISDNEYAFNSVKYDNNSIIIDIENAFTTDVTIEIINIMGDVVIYAVNETLPNGKYTIQKELNLPTGVYFCRFNSGPYSEIKKFYVIK